MKSNIFLFSASSLIAHLSEMQHAFAAATVGVKFLLLVNGKCHHSAVLTVRLTRSKWAWWLVGGGFTADFISSMNALNIPLEVSFGLIF